jgi:hypothetical protein
MGIKRDIIITIIISIDNTTAWLRRAMAYELLITPSSAYRPHNNTVCIENVGLMINVTSDNKIKMIQQLSVPTVGPFRGTLSCCPRSDDMNGVTENHHSFTLHKLVGFKVGFLQRMVGRAVSTLPPETDQPPTIGFSGAMCGSASWSQGRRGHTSLLGI